MTPKLIDKHMRESLLEAIRILFPVGVQPIYIVRHHSWGNPTYVGKIENRPCSWRGWSANLIHIHPDYYAVFVDYVENKLPEQTRIDLFGEEFNAAVRDLSSYIVFYVGRLSHEDTELIHEAGFTKRVIGRGAHACKIIDPNGFHLHPPIYWAGYIARLVNLQKAILIDNAQSMNHQPRKSDWRAMLDWEAELGLLDV